MAEGRFSGSGEELPKSKPAQTKKPRRAWQEEMERPRSAMARPGTRQELPAPKQYVDRAVSAPDLSELTITDYEEESDQQLATSPRHSTLQPPSPPTVTWQSWNRPTTKVSVSGSAVKVSTEYRLKELSPESTEITPEIPPELLPSSKPVTRRPTTPSVPSGAKSREIAEELYQTKQEFFKVKQLPKEKINLKYLPILYHENYNLKLLGTMKVNYPFMLLNKPAKIFALLKEDLFEKYNCDCIEVEETDFRVYSDDSYSVIPDAVKKCDIVEVTKILKVKFSELPSWSVFDSAMLYPLRLQVNGSLQACGVAMKMGWAIHIGGGFGHNSPTFSKGLAVYDDILHCLLTLPISVPGHDIKHVLIINYEARKSPNYTIIREIKFPVTILDFHLEEMPVSEKVPTQYVNKLVKYRPIKIEGNATAHLGIAQKKIESFIASTETLPSLCIYIAGTDIVDHPDIPSFKQDHAKQRDLDVFKTVQIEKHIPIAIIMGGGSEETDAKTAAASITELCRIGCKRLNLADLVEKKS